MKASHLIISSLLLSFIRGDSLWLSDCFSQKESGKFFSHPPSSRLFQEPLPQPNVVVIYHDQGTLVFESLEDLTRIKHPENVKILTIQNLNIRFFPEILNRFKNLEILDLSNNQMSCESLKSFPDLREIHKVFLNSNEITEECFNKFYPWPQSKNIIISPETIKNLKL